MMGRKETPAGGSDTETLGVLGHPPIRLDIYVCSVHAQHPHTHWLHVMNDEIKPH